MTWSRTELKDKAKINLKTNYWRAVLAALIASCLYGGSTGTSSGSTMANMPDTLSSFEDLSSGDFEILLFVLVTIACILFVSWVIGLLLSVFLLNPLQVGTSRFFLACDEEKPSFRNIGCAFSPAYKNTIKTMFLMYLFTGLWTLLFIVPGIIKAYEYRMIPYILAENPELSTKEIFARSKEMMNGDKGNAFVLDLSFIGWILLSSITCGLLAIFYVAPYQYLTNAELYKTLKKKLSAQSNYTVETNPYYAQ